MKNSIKKGSVLLFIGLSILLTSCAKKSEFAEMEFEEQTHDFGNIKQGDKVSYDFKFTNTGGADLKIESANGSCGCTVPEYPKTPIKSGESAVMKVTFNSAGKSGDVTKSVTIMCNTKNQMEKIKIKANIETPEKGTTN